MLVLVSRGVAVPLTVQVRSYGTFAVPAGHTVPRVSVLAPDYVALAHNFAFVVHLVVAIRYDMLSVPLFDVSQ